MGLVTLVRKPSFQAVIKSAASAASPPAWGAADDGVWWDDGVGRTTERDSDDGLGRSPSRRGGCASSRLDHGLKVWLDPYIKGTKKATIHRFFAIFSAVFPNIWPLAGPNIAKKGGPLQKLARVDRQTHFGTFNFWLKPGF